MAKKACTVSYSKSMCAQRTWTSFEVDEDQQSQSSVGFSARPSVDILIRPKLEIKTKSQKFRENLLETIMSWQIRIEVVVMALGICDTARLVATPSLLLAKVKRDYPLPSNLSQNEISHFYNKLTVRWDSNYTYVNIPLACIAIIIFGDRRGRKLPMIVGILGMVLGNGIYMLVWWKSVDLRLEYIYLAAFLDGISGGYRLVLSSASAYLSDQYSVKRRLSIRMIITFISFNVGDLLGSQLTDLCTVTSSELFAMIVVQCILIATLFYIILFVKNIIPKSATSDSFIQIITNAFRSLWNSLKVVREKRSNYCRLLLALSLICAFIHRLSFSEQKRLIGTYTKLPPFKWDTEQLALYKTVRPCYQILGLLFGLALKKYLHLRDTAILVMATLSRGADCLLIGLADSSLLINVSLAIGFMHGLVEPLIYSFLTCLVNSDEIGRVFSTDAVVENVALFLRTAILQSIYTETMDWEQNFIWLLLASMSLFTASIFITIHFISKKNGVGDQ